MNNIKTFTILSLLTAVALALVLTTCDLEPDADIPAVADGIVIYSGREVLNDTTWEIVTNRVQQLRAASTSGHTVEWSSDNERGVYVDPKSGRIRSGQSPNQTALITATSVQDPTIKASVTFKTKGLR